MKQTFFLLEKKKIEREEEGEVFLTQKSMSEGRAMRDEREEDGHDIPPPSASSLPLLSVFRIPIVDEGGEKDPDEGMGLGLRGY